MSALLAPSGTDFGPDAATWEAFTRLTAGQPWLLDVGEAVAVLLHPWTMRGLVGLGCVLAWRHGRRRTALVVAATMVFGSAAGVGLKLWIRRDRPPFGDAAAAELGYSMPSGHALNGALGLGLLVVLAWPWLRARGRERTAVAVAVVLTAAVCLDRLVLGVHYLSDVVVGAAIGAALTAGAAAVVSRTGLGDRTRRTS